MTYHRKKVIVITGPTAVGKTGISIQVARALTTSIISCDSRQCFQEMNIGVARPSIEELSQVPHYFIASHSIHNQVTAAIFEQYALEKTAGIFSTHDNLVLTGGTGLYMKAFIEGMDLMPDIPESLREEITHHFHQKGIEWLQQQIREKDPLFFQKGEMKNPQRMMRALEVIKASGHSILNLQNRPKPARDFEVIKFGLELPKEILHQRINARVQNMMTEGLLEEVRRLSPFRQLNALQTVGYRELFEYFDGKIELEQAVEQIQKNTRAYAKRQMTWFRKDAGIQWVPSTENSVEYILHAIKRSNETSRS